jgi:ribosome-binding factor A
MSGQIDELLKTELGKLIAERIELNDGLITIVFVHCSPDLQRAKVAVSVLPERLTGTALRELKRHTAGFATYLKKHTRLRHIPILDWQLDITEKEAAKLDDVFRQIEEERKNTPEA